MCCLRLSVSIAEGRRKLPALQSACASGKWLQNNGKVGKPVKASIVGVLAVRPDSWRCGLQSADGQWVESFPKAQATEPPKRAGRSSGWEAWRADARPGEDYRWPSGSPGSSSGSSGRSNLQQLSAARAKLRAEAKVAVRKRPASQVS